jgi:hypothetical protein
VAHPKDHPAGRFHAVQFYQDDQSLVDSVSKFLAEGCRQNQPALIVATAEHRRGIEQALAGHGLDVGRMKQLGDLVSLDARETLDTILAAGMPHPRLFSHVFNSMLKEVARIHPDCTTRAYGEMVNLLWQDGMTSAAIRLETLWNELAKSHDFKLLCGYSMGNFYRDAAVGEIARHHTHVLAETGEAATVN